MNSNLRIARIVRALFVTVMVAWAVGFALINPILNAPDYLPQVSENETQVMVGVLFELIEVAGVVGIIVLMFLILRKQNESLALGYAGFRIFEITMLIVAALAALVQITLSQGYLEGESHEFK